MPISKPFFKKRIWWMFLFRFCAISRCTMWPITVRRTVSDCWLSDCWLSDSMLSNSTLFDSTLSDSMLFDSVLSGSMLSDSMLPDSWLSDSKLSDSAVTPCCLTAAFLSDFMLSDADAFDIYIRIYPTTLLSDSCPVNKHYCTAARHIELIHIIY